MFFPVSLELDKFEGADFKYHNIIFKFQPKNTQIKHLGPKFKDFYFCTKLCKKTNSKTLISNVTKIFSNSSRKIPKSDIFGPKLKDFYVCTKVCNKTNSGTQISNMTIVFSNSTPKIRKWSIFGPKFRHFCLFTKFCN